MQQPDGQAVAEGEAARILQICNACRYCEGFCAVFPAMTRRLAFDRGDIHYLANLCHNCGACLHACQYAPPHDFAVNVPRAMAQVRQKTYQEYAWPGSVGRLYAHNGTLAAVLSGASIAAFFLVELARRGELWERNLGANFYILFPHNALVLIFGVAFAWAVIALFMGVLRFWRDQAPGPVSGPAVREAAHHALALTYLGGGHGDGCNETDDRFTLIRRRFHHLTFYGFLLCAASTATATLYHYALKRYAPYPVTSIPVMLGALGGIGLTAGCLGLFWLHLRRHSLHGDPAQKPMDRAFMAMLVGTSVSGLALLVLRQTTAMGALLAIHLGCVLTLFLALPYSKFSHAAYRCAALLRWTNERRQPSQLKLAPD